MTILPFLLTELINHKQKQIFGHNSQIIFIIFYYFSRQNRDINL